VGDAAGTLAPIVLFVYNRPLHTRNTIAALQLNELAPLSDLVIFSDGAKDIAAESGVRDVRTFLKTVRGFKSIQIVERGQNLGLAESIISGVTRVCGQYGRVIVLEDDLLTAPTFLGFMNDALNMYAGVDRVGSVHGYWYPARRPVPACFFLRGASCWGWATWSRAWGIFERDGRKLLADLETRRLTRPFDLDGAMPYTKMLKSQIAKKNDSWAIRWHAANFLADRLQLSPGQSLVRNVGWDGTGVHCLETSVYDVELAARQVMIGNPPIEESSEARAALIDYYRSIKRSLPRRMFGRLRRMARAARGGLGI
jgi:hypothetical protein